MLHTAGAFLAVVYGHIENVEQLQITSWLRETEKTAKCLIIVIFYGEHVFFSVWVTALGVWGSVCMATDKVEKKSSTQSIFIKQWHF